MCSKVGDRLKRPLGEWGLLGHIQGLDMSSQQSPQARRFPIEAGDCPSSAVPPETQEPVGTERSVGRQLRRCPGSHCLTLPNVPIDVFIATGGSGRPRI
ncbi:protein FAM229A [Balearica regulorum gibbericeps]|uniref:protein FAM229A n=1 Tax=Balearica regulorum gibbericeps TaxID=100784 RepID=UPI003F6109A2